MIGLSSIDLTQSSYKYILMQVETPNPRSKAEDTVSKCEELLKEKKYYEYGQKVKLFAHRKLQGKKVKEALYILQIAAIKLLSIGEDKQGQQLVAEWIKSIQEHKQEFTQDLFKQFMELYSIKPSDQRAGQLQRLVKTFRDKLSVQDKQLVNQALVQEYIRKGQYSSAEKYALYQQQSKGETFLKMWCQKLEEHEAQFVKMRFALLKILYGREEEGESIIAQINKGSPFRRFADNLVQCFQRGCRQGFEKIGTAYSSLLEEPSMQKIYEGLGYAVFGIKNNSGMGLLSSLLK